MIVSEADGSSFSSANIALVHDDIKETLIQFIEEFRKEWEKKRRRTSTDIS